MFALRSSNTLGMYTCRWEPMICAAMFSLLLQSAVEVPGYGQGRCTLRLWRWCANQSQVSAQRTLDACMEDNRLQRKQNGGSQQERPPPPPFISIPCRPSARHSRACWLALFCQANTKQAGRGRASILPVRMQSTQTRAVDLLLVL